MESLKLPTVSFRCFGCKARFSTTARVSVEEALHLAIAQGWGIVGSLPYCPECSASRAVPTEAKLERP